MGVPSGYVVACEFGAVHHLTTLASACRVHATYINGYGGRRKSHKYTLNRRFLVGWAVNQNGLTHL